MNDFSRAHVQADIGNVKLSVMDKRVRITTVENHESFRREDMKLISPKKRVETLIKIRDRLYPYEPLERTVSYRNLY